MAPSIRLHRPFGDCLRPAQLGGSHRLADRVHSGTNEVGGHSLSKAKNNDPAQRADLRAAVDVVEKNTDTSWAMFQALQGQQERGFEKTRPNGLASPGQQAAVPEAVTIDDVLVEARRNNRVCPLPAIWQRLYAYLPNAGPHLSKVPATHAEWQQVPALQKRARLREHIEWAASQGVLRQVYEALRKLPENRWHHIGE